MTFGFASGALSRRWNRHEAPQPNKPLRPSSRQETEGQPRQPDGFGAEAAKAEPEELVLHLMYGSRPGGRFLFYGSRNCLVTPAECALHLDESPIHPVLKLPQLLFQPLNPFAVGVRPRYPNPYLQRTSSDAAVPGLQRRLTRLPVSSWKGIPERRQKHLQRGLPLRTASRLHEPVGHDEKASEVKPPPDVFHVLRPSPSGAVHGQKWDSDGQKTMRANGEGWGRSRSWVRAAGFETGANVSPRR